MTDTQEQKPVVVGAGFVALDAVITDERRDEPVFRAGGTCGNVLTILSFLGWEAFPVLRLNGDPASRLLQEDLARWAVRLDLASLEPHARTPIVIHRIRRDGSGHPYHTFGWNCPQCGAHLPRFAPVHSSAVRDAAERFPKPSVFFMDRASRASIDLARSASAAGAVVVFEPSGIGDFKLFQQALSVTHVLKYSHERMGQLDELGQIEGPLLEIETLGRWGLAVRSRLNGCETVGWEKYQGYNVSAIRDTAGAGDWCTAGFLDSIARRGIAGLRACSAEALADALAFGQALAAWNCAFDGARGGMYSEDRSALAVAVQGIMRSEPWNPVGGETTSGRGHFRDVCTSCDNRSASSPELTDGLADS